MMAPRNPVTIQLIKQCVAPHYNISPTEFTSRRQGGQARTRQVAMYLAATLSACSLPEIGRAFHRDHTTVLYARRIVEQRMIMDAVLKADIRELRIAIFSAANPLTPSDTLAVRLVLDTAAAFRSAGLAMAARDPAATIQLIAPLAAAIGVTVSKEVPSCG